MEKKLKRANSSNMRRSFDSQIVNQNINVNIIVNKNYSRRKSMDFNGKYYQSSMSNIVLTREKSLSKIYITNDVDENHKETVYTDYKNVSCINMKITDIDDVDHHLTPQKYYNFFENTIIDERKQAKLRFKGRLIESIRQQPTYSMINSSTSSNSMTLISDNILLGGKADSEDINTLKDFGVTHILNIAQQCTNHFPESFVYLKIPILDSNQNVNITDYKELVVKYLSHIEDINGRVLIHCLVGVSRSVSVLIMYLVVHHRIPLKHAFGYVKSCRMQISPNDAFKYQLALLETEEFGFSSVAKDADKTWDFYEWNSIRRSLPTKNINGEGFDDYHQCCIVT